MVLFLILGWDAVEPVYRTLPYQSRQNLCERWGSLISSQVKPLSVPTRFQTWPALGAEISHCERNLCREHVFFEGPTTRILGPQGDLDDPALVREALGRRGWGYDLGGENWG